MSSKEANVNELIKKVVKRPSVLNLETMNMWRAECVAMSSKVTDDGLKIQNVINMKRRHYFCEGDGSPMWLIHCKLPYSYLEPP